MYVNSEHKFLHQFGGLLKEGGLEMIGCGRQETKDTQH